MMIFTDGSAQGNLSPTGYGIVIKNSEDHSSPIKLEDEIEAVKLGIDYAF